MRILIISTFFPPQNSIASLRPYSWAKYWTQMRHEVTVLTVFKDKDAPNKLSLPNNGFRLIEVLSPSWLQNLKRSYQPDQAKNTSFLGKLYEWFRFKKGIFHATRFPDWSHFWISPAIEAIRGEAPWDLVISSSGPYSVHLVANELKKMGKVNMWVADYRDLWSNSVIYPGLFPFNIYERMLEKNLLKQADFVTTVSDPLSERLNEDFPNVKTTTIENGFDPDDLVTLNPDNIFPEDGKKRIVYSGSIYLGKQDPSPLFKAIAECARDEKGRKLLNSLEVIFIGLHQANVSELIEKYQVSNYVKSCGFVNREEALRMQRDADVLLFLPWNDRKVDGVLTGKIFEYLFSRTPIISVGGSYTDLSQKLIEETRSGRSLNSVESIQNYLITLLNNPPQSKINLDEALLQRYTRKHLAEKLLSKVIE